MMITFERLWLAPDGSYTFISHLYSPSVYSGGET
jgi:hypothetical protein